MMSLLPISVQVDSAFATETVNSGSIPGRVKRKGVKIGTPHNVLYKKKDSE